MSVDRQTMKQLMEEESGSSLLVMIILLVLSEVLLIAPIVVAAWKLAGTPDLIQADALEPAAGSAGN